MRVRITDIRDNLADVLNRVAYGGERLVLERRGKGVAALVSMDDLALLQRRGRTRPTSRPLARP